MILYEAWTTYRQIFTDGRACQRIPIRPGWDTRLELGNGDTLVVDTAGLNDKSWLDLTGHPHTEALHVMERYRRSDLGRWRFKSRSTTQGLSEALDCYRKRAVASRCRTLEFICNENEKDVPHLVGK